jgi:hypothetical protein
VRRSAGLTRAILCGAIALACAAAGLFLALHHPLSGAAAAGLWLVAALLAARWPDAWLTALPALLPAIGFAPWSGWLVVEEWDLAVLAVAAAGYARLAHAEPAPDAAPGPRPVVPLLGLLFGLSVAFAAWRGLGPGAVGWSWWQGYHEPLNGVREAKPFAAMLLLWPLWRHARRRDPVGAGRRLGAGLVGALAVVALLTLRERLAYTALTDFSSDYRVSAEFWEMHVGGAALDAVLALAMPFALLGALRGRSAAARLASGAALAAGAYATLVTFSRIGYAGVPLGLALTAWLALRQRGRAEATPAKTLLASAALPALAYVACVGATFGSSGYRGALALFGLFVFGIAVAPHWRVAAAGERRAGVAFGVVAATAAGALALLVDKGAYVAYALAALAGVGAWASRLLLRRPQVALEVATAVALAAAAVAVAAHWGGGGATPAMAAAALAGLVAAGLLARRGEPAGPAPLLAAAAAMAVATVAVGIFAGGRYMSDRIATTSGDAGYRTVHWQRALDLLDGPDEWLLGKGLGRFPASLFASGRTEDQTGDARWLGGDDPHVVLSGGKHVLGWGEIFRLSQRVAPLRAPAVVSFEARAEQALRVHVEVCQKHLLYNADCLATEVEIAAAPGRWQPVTATFDSGAVGAGAWWAPRRVVFAVGVATRGARVEIDRLSLRGADGAERLHNGDFGDGLARWFISSDHHHMPWHVKNLALHVLFGQGLVGVVLLAALLAVAGWRLVVGSARSHPLAPALAGALAGFLVVGTIDSLLDAPRVAFLFFLLLLAALTVPPVRAVGART